MKSDGSFKIFLIASLCVLVVCSTYLAAAMTLERQAQREHRVIYEAYMERAQALLDQQQWIVSDAADSYHAKAYTPGVERIAEQQLIAAEYQLLLLQAIAQQNAVMIELMIVAGP